MAIEDELLAIRLELKGQRETIAGLKETEKSTKGVGASTRKAGEEAAVAEKRTLNLGNAYSKVGTHAKLALGFLGVGGVFALEKATENSEELALATSSLSRNFGFSTAQASRWAAVMHSRDVDPKAMTQAFGTLATKMVEAGRKGGTLLTPFHLLGISQEEVAYGAKHMEWGLMRVTKALGDEEGGAKRSAAAKALLGKGFQTLTPLMADGVKGLREQLHWADEYGVTLNKVSEEDLFNMVKSQRELKIGMLGVQVAMTKALMPAIEAGEAQLKDFFETLNDPDLSAEQKINRIEHQFLGLEDDLIRVIEQALPGVAEHAGQLGLKMAGSVWHGFTHSGSQGRAVILGYIAFTIAGPEIKAAVFRAGGEIGTRFSVGIVAGVTGAYIGYEIGEHLSEETKESIYNWGVHAGEWFINGLIKLINRGIDEINSTLDEINALSFLGVEAPNIGHVGEVGFSTGTPGLRHQEERAHRHVEEGLIEGPGGKPVKPYSGPRHPKHGASPRRNTMLEVPRLPDLGALVGAAGRGAGPTHVHIHIDGKQVAEVVTQHAEDAAAFR